MTQYAICRNGRFLKYTKEGSEYSCWMLFLIEHKKLGGTYGCWKDFIDEAKQLGFEVKEFNEVENEKISSNFLL